MIRLMLALVLLFPTLATAQVNPPAEWLKSLGPEVYSAAHKVETMAEQSHDLYDMNGVTWARLGNAFENNCDRVKFLEAMLAYGENRLALGELAVRFQKAEAKVAEEYEKEFNNRRKKMKEMETLSQMETEFEQMEAGFKNFKRWVVNVDSFRKKLEDASKGDEKLLAKAEERFAQKR